MSVSNFLSLAIETALIGKVVRTTKNFVLESDYFGEFVSVERQKKINGCIGYWDENYNVLDKKTLIEKVAQSSYSATWTDSRHKDFNKSIYTELNTEYKIYFMYGATLFNESEVVGDSFDNTIYGIIVSDSQNRATFLPEVYPEAGWNYIKGQLLDKAGISESNYKFYKYQTHTISCTLLDYLLLPTVSFFNTNYRDTIPYSVGANGQITTDVTQCVRNVSSIYTLLLIDSVGYKFNANVLKNIRNEIDYYTSNIVQQNGEYQCKAFLLLVLNKMNIDGNIVKYLVKQLYTITHNLEPVFELGQVLLALCDVNPIIPRLEKEFENIKKHNEPKHTNSIKLDDIFRLNWHVQFLCCWIKHVDPRAEASDNPAIFVINTIEDQINYIFAKMHSTTIETNYEAVMYEAITSIYYIKNKYKMDTKKIEKIIQELFIRLNLKADQNGLYKFTEGSARIDITSHVIGGYLNLMCD